ncbi:MAG: site-2 protease family protein [Cyanobacteria bacterium P01_H01_bin.121]
MQSGLRIGSIFGIPLFINPSWLVIIALIAFGFTRDWQVSYPQWGSLLTWVAGFATALLLFASVLLHELGHSLVARSQGIRVNSITLFLLCGIAAIDEESKTPGQAFQVAIAGPAVSFCLYGGLLALLQVLPQASPGQVLVEHLAHINLVLGLFNLIPGLPLDGGQVLKSAVWKVTGSRFAGVQWAARAGRALGWTAITLGIAIALVTQVFGGYWIALLGWFGLQNANTYDRVSTLQEALLKLTAAEAMSRDFRVIDANLNLRQFAELYLLEERHPKLYFAASDGRYRGQISVDALRQIERSWWDRQTVQSLAKPLVALPSVQERTPLAQVILKLEQQRLNTITVLSPADAVAGVIDRAEIVRLLAQRLNLRISPTELQQIQVDGHYPPTLQLVAIAKSVLSDLQPG